MIPGNYNITIYKGATWSINITSKDANGLLLDFTTKYINNPTDGAGTAKLQIRNTWADMAVIPIENPLFELSIENNRILINNTTLTLTVSAEDTALLDFETGVYDLSLITGETPAIKDKLMRGTVTVIDGVTI